MSTASRGRAAEHRIINALKEAGYDVVRGAGSKGNLAVFRDEDGKKVHMPVDFIATRCTGRSTTEVYMIAAQVKYSVGR